MSLVKVFIPCYNYARFLPECVESVLNQPGVDVRVLILDDASPDNTPEVAAALAARDSRVEYRRHGANQGHIATFNEGLAWAEDGDYTVLLSADDLLAPGALLRATWLMEAHPEVGFVYGRALKFTSDEPRPQPRNPVGSGRWKIWSGPEWLESTCASGHIYIRSPEVVVRTRLQRALGRYRAELPHTGDMEMWMRFAAHAGVGEILDADQAFYRVHNQNMHLQHFSTHLADLRQRKAAFDIFFQNYGSHVPGRKRLASLAYCKLAREALGMAGSAFDRGEIERTPIAELVAFAHTTYPGVASTLEYAGLHGRMLLGPRVAPWLYAVRKLELPGWLGTKSGER